MDVKKILIVDDDEEDREFFVAVVAEIDQSIEVVLAESRDELFLKLDQAIPDLLFVDSIIQHESGHDAIQEIKAKKEFQGLPVIMYTGSCQMDNIRKAFEAGAASYIVKPHSLTEIKKVLEEVLQTDWAAKSSSQRQYYVSNSFIDYDI